MKRIEELLEEQIRLQKLTLQYLAISKLRSETAISGEDVERLPEQWQKEIALDILELSRMLRFHIPDLAQLGFEAAILEGQLLRQASTRRTLVVSANGSSLADVVAAESGAGLATLERSALASGVLAGQPFTDILLQSDGQMAAGVSGFGGFACLDLDASSFIMRRESFLRTITTVIREACVFLFRVKPESLLTPLDTPVPRYTFHIRDGICLFSDRHVRGVLHNSGLYDVVNAVTIISGMPQERTPVVSRTTGFKEFEYLGDHRMDCGENAEVLIAYLGSKRSLDSVVRD